MKSADDVEWLVDLSAADAQLSVDEVIRAFAGQCDQESFLASPSREANTASHLKHFVQMEEARIAKLRPIVGEYTLLLAAVRMRKP